MNCAYRVLLSAHMLEKMSDEAPHYRWRRPEVNHPKTRLFQPNVECFAKETVFDLLKIKLEEKHPRTNRK